MAEATPAPATSGAAAYFTTSYSPGSGTTSTTALIIWRTLSQNLTNQSLPMTGAELSQVTGISIEALERIFSQTYYKRHYGFRRFDTLDEWRTWAMENGVLYNPALHDVKPAPDFDDEDDDEDDYDEDEDEDAE